MTNENNSPDAQNQQDNSNVLDTAERKRISRLADDLAKRARERQLRYDDGHNIFTK
jgi:RNA polymerase-interacting CarD/CdnL/TRCF family regulator